MKTIKVFTAFAGYDSQMMALKRLEESMNHAIKFTLVGWCEIDEDAIRSHNAVFPEYKQEFDPATGTGYHHKDITKSDWSRVPYFDLFIYSSCCQDLTRTGNQRGLEEGSGTRSSLIWYCREAIRIIRPQWALLENVQALVEHTFMPSFIKWQRSVDALGYRSTWQVLNAANYGIPQARNRVFMLSTRQDLGQVYRFPQRIPRNISLCDYLDDTVAENYYCTNTDTLHFIRSVSGYKMADRYPTSLTNVRGGEIARDLYTGRPIQIVTPTCRGGDCAPTITATAYANATYRNAVTLGYFPKMLVVEVWQSCSAQELDYASLLTGEPSDGGVTNGSKDKIISTVNSLLPGQYVRLRKLTPRELLRLMGVSERDIDKMTMSGVQESQLYKQAGNSIVVDVLYHIFRSLFEHAPEVCKSLSGTYCPNTRPRHTNVCKRVLHKSRCRAHQHYSDTC